MGTRNFNAGTRDMEQAGQRFADERYDSFSSAATVGERWSQFTDYLKERNEGLEGSDRIGRMERIDKETVQAYAEKLNERYENGELSASAVNNYLSAVNVVMEQARGDQDVRVTGAEAGLPSRSGVATEFKGVSESQHREAQSQVSERLSAQMEAQRSIGLRFEESAKMNYQAAYQEAQKNNNYITVQDGTKGGREREVQVTERGLQALEAAAKIQGDHYSMIPKDQTYAQYQSQCYREVGKTEVNFHAERHSYANDRYEQLTGSQSPVESGRDKEQQIEHLANEKGISHAEAKELDREAREQISQELGHNRVEITNSYLG